MTQIKNSYWFWGQKKFSKLMDLFFDPYNNEVAIFGTKKYRCKRRNIKQLKTLNWPKKILQSIA